MYGKAEFIPLNVLAGSREFDGTGVVDAALASPQFTANSYGATPQKRKLDLLKVPGTAVHPSAWPGKFQKLFADHVRHH